jgi:membrane-associated phospholipid phosphatase
MFLMAAAIWASVAVLCARYDLAISRHLVDSGASWAIFGERYGSLPGVYALALSSSLLYCHSRPDNRRSRRADAALWALCSVCVAMSIAVSAYRLAGYRFSALEGLACCCTVAALSWLWRASASRGSGLPLRTERACRWTVWLGSSSWLLVYALKTIWGRVRYRDLDALHAAFTPWYLPQGHTGHASFPSGHAAMGWLLLPCLLLWPARSRAWRVGAVLSIGWGCFVGASRLVIGAHYASDVLFSTAFASTVMCFALQARASGLSEPTPTEPGPR